LIAVAHSIVVIIYHILLRREPYRELGADYFAQRKPEAAVKRLTRQIERLGYTVTVLPPAEAAGTYIFRLVELRADLVSVVSTAHCASRRVTP
jgi:hypothetical protein